MKAEVLYVPSSLQCSEILYEKAAYAAKKLEELGIDTSAIRPAGSDSDRVRECIAGLGMGDFVVIIGEGDWTYTSTALWAAVGHLVQKDMTYAREYPSDGRQEHVDVGYGCSVVSLQPPFEPVEAVRHIESPGLAVESCGRCIVLLYGTAEQLESITNNNLIPYLKSRLIPGFQSHIARIFGLSRSSVEERLTTRKEIPHGNVIVVNEQEGEVEVQITASGADYGTREMIMAQQIDSLVQLFPHNLYGIDVQNLQTVLVRQLAARGARIATAESCTGGLVSKRITDVPGASDVFECGICSYSNNVKHRLLRVRENTLNSFGAVSAETACEMAEGVLRLAGATIGVATTGLAGPTGGTPDTPVGTVFIGVATHGGTRVCPMHFKASADEGRTWIRNMAAKYALFQSLLTVTGGVLIA